MTGSQPSVISSPAAIPADHGVPNGTPPWSARWNRVAGRIPWSLLAVLLAFKLCRRGYLSAVSLDEQSYFEPSILVEGLKQPLALAMLMVPLGIGIWKYRELSWQQFEHQRAVKWFVAAAAGILAYAYSTYEYNVYFDQFHAVDRCLLVLLACLIPVHPIFSGAFVWMVLLMIGQFDYPIGNYTWTPMAIVFSTVLLFVVFIYCEVWRKRGLREFVFLAVCLVASNYVHSGFKKLRLNWLFSNDVSLLGVQSYVNGWLGHLDPQTLHQVVEWMRWLNMPILVFTVVIELALLFSFFHKRVLVWGLVGCVLLHVGIFAASGICFWKWVLLDVALIVLIQKTSPRWGDYLFHRRDVAWTGVLLILAAPWYFKPVSLGWYDTPLNNSFEMEVVGESGRVYPVSRQFFSPYDCTVSQNRFWYLLPQKYLVGTYGATANAELRDQLEAAREPSDIAAIEQRFGLIEYDAGQAETFDRFVTSFFARLNDRQQHAFIPAALHAPPHVWSSAPVDSYAAQEPAQQVRVRYLVTWYHEGAIDVLRNEVVREIDVSSKVTASAQSTTGRR